MSAVTRALEKYGNVKRGTDKTDKSPSVSSASTDRSPSVSSVSAPTYESQNFSADEDNATRIARLRRQRAEKARESRRAEVLAMMRQSPGRVAYRAFDDGHADGITLAIGIPSIGTAELTIPRDRYDPAALMALFEATHGPAVEPEHVADSGHSLGTAETL